jgi:FkbM family methyltransferase
MRVIFYDSFITPLMSGVSVLRIFGNKLYQHAFPIYRPVYAAYKAYADHAVRQLLRQVLVPGAVAIDAGANIGIYSQFLSRCVGPTGVVHAFEPSPENFKRLQSAARNLSNVRLSQAALGERTRSCELYVSDTLNVDHRTYATEQDSRRVIPINLVALDDYFEVGQRVDLVKMDIQGYELNALRGANRVLAENPAVKLLLELWPYGLKQAGASWLELVDTLRGKNMLIYEITSQRLAPFDVDSVRESPEWYVNLFAASR